MHSEVGKLVAHAEAFGAACHNQESSNLFSRFLNLAKIGTHHASHTRAEVSLKVTECAVHPMRFNFWMVGADMTCWRHIRHFTEQKADLPPLIAAVCERSARKGVAQLVIGVDLRETDRESRAKLWLLLRNRPRVVDDILEWSGIDSDAFRALRSYENFLVGLDLYSGGKVETKIYFRHLVRPHNLSILDRHVSKWTQNLLRESEVVHFLFRQDGQRVSYFAPKRPRQFIHMLPTTHLPKLRSSVDALTSELDMVGLLEEDLKAGVLRSCNLYSGFNSVHFLPRESTVMFG